MESAVDSLQKSREMFAEIFPDVVTRGTINF